MGWTPSQTHPGYYVNEHGQAATAQQLAQHGIPVPQAQPAGYPPNHGYGQPYPAQAAAPFPPQAQQGYYPQPTPQQPAQALPQQRQMPNFVEPQSTALPQTGYARQGGDRLFVDFPKLEQAGQSATLLLRFLPVTDDRDRFFTVMEHGLPLEIEAILHPQQQRRQSNKRRYNVLCADFGDGPKGCAVCAFRRTLQEPYLSQLKNLLWGGKRIRHLVINLSDPRMHWVQAKDANGQPVLNPDNGQPHWIMVPGEFSIGSEGYTSLTQVQAMVPAPIESRDRGRVIQIMKTKTGAGQNEVSYRADPGQEMPLMGTHYEPILHNLYSIRERIAKYPTPDAAAKITEFLKHKLGMGGASYGMPSPGMPMGFNPGMGYTSAPGGPAPMGFPGGAPNPGVAPGMPPMGSPMGAPQGMPYGAPQGGPPASPGYMPMGVPGGMPPMGPPVGAPVQFQQPPAPGPLSPQQLPQAPQGAFPGQLPPMQAPGMHAIGFAPGQPPQGAPQQQAPQGPPQGQFQAPPFPQLGAPQGVPQGAPQQHQQPPMGQQPLPFQGQAPQQQGAPQQPTMSPQELERAVTPAGGSIPF